MSLLIGTFYVLATRGRASSKSAVPFSLLSPSSFLILIRQSIQANEKVIAIKQLHYKHKAITTRSSGVSNNTEEKKKLKKKKKIGKAKL